MREVKRMDCPFTRCTTRLETILFFALAAAVFHPSAAIAQSYCGPLVPVNFAGLNGQYPTGPLTIDGQGNVYGTTSQGGPTYNPSGSPQVEGDGIIWKYSPSSGLTTLYAFSAVVGQNAVVIDSQGNLWGSTTEGGTGDGSLFELTPAGAFNTVFEFSGANGQNPGPLVFDSQGNLWGSTSAGGANGTGTLFEYSPAAQQLTNPLSFPSGTETTGGGPIAFDSQGNIYGLTGAGGTAGLGSIWEYSPASNTLTTLFSFTGLNGREPSGFTLDGKGNIYGTTSLGGAGDVAPASGYGEVWKYSLQTGVLTVLYSFTASGTTGQFPAGGVALDANGNLYGATGYGGTNDIGVVWEYSSAGVLSDLVTFNFANGAIGESLVMDSKSNLWGATNQSGANGGGTVLELTPNTGAGCGPTISSLTFNPTTITNGGTSTGTVTLSAAAPSGGSVVGLAGNSSFLNVPGSVTVPAGDTSATFEITTNGFVNSNTPDTITASLGSSTVQATLTETAGVAVASFSVSPNSVPGGSSTTGTVTLTAAAPAGGNEVQVEPSQAQGGIPSPPVIPVIVTVAAGQTKATFTLETVNVSSKETIVVFASSGGANVSTNLTVTPGPQISSLTLSLASVKGGTSTTGTVTLNVRAPSGGAVVTLTSGNTSAATVPSSVTVATGATSATFTVSSESVSSTTTVAISGTYGGETQSAALTVTPATTMLSSLTLSPTSTVGGNASFGVVNLNAAAPSGGAVVPLTNSDPSVANVPSSVTVAAGFINATFTVTTQSVLTSTNVTISGTYGGATQSVTLNVTPASIGSLTLNPTSVAGGSSSTGNVTLNGYAPPGGAVVTLTSGNTSVGTVPSSVTVAAGTTSATFSVSTQSVPTGTSVTISGTYGGATQFATLTVTPAAAVTISSLTLNPTSVTGGSSSTGTVNLTAGAPSGGAVVTLSSNSGSATVPTSVTVAAGNTSASFTITTTPVATTTTAVITGTLGSGSAQASLTILPAASVSLSSLTLNPTSVSGGSSSTGTVTLSANAPSGGAVVTLASGNTSVATVPSSVTVAAGSTSATFTVSTQRVSQNTNVAISGTYAGATQSATLTVTSGRHH